MILRRRSFIYTWVHISTSDTTIVVAEIGFWACIYIFYSNISSKVFNLWGLDKYKSNYTGDGQTEGKTRTEVRTGNIYEFVQSNIVTRCVT